MAMVHYILSLVLFFTINFTSVLASQDREQRDPNYAPIRTTRLVTDTDHTQFLKDALATATNQVMISTYNVSPKRLFEDGLGQAIIDAYERDVAVYVYFENQS